jgi:hypothetical protein
MTNQPPAPDPHDPDPSEQEIDEFAKRAGASLRRSAPTEGAAKVMQRGSAIRTRRLATGFAAVGVLAVGGIFVATRNGDKSSSNLISPAPVVTPSPNSEPEATSAPAPTDAPTTTAEPTTTTAALSPEDAWALNYVGGSAGPPVGDPVRIGFAHPATAVTGEASAAAVSFLNDSLGGITGQPVELVDCAWSDSATASACGTQFANDATIQLVLTTDDTYPAPGSNEFSTALGDEKPSFGGFVVSLGEQRAYEPSLQADVLALFSLARQLLPAGPLQIAIISDGDYRNLSPTVPDVSIVGVLVTDFSSSASSIADQIRAANAEGADVFAMVNPGFYCEALRGALELLGGSPIVIVNQCDFREEGWYYLDVPYNPDSPSVETGAAMVAAKTRQYGVPRGDGVGGFFNFPALAFGNVLTAAKILNSLGEGATTAEIRQALLDFTGPAIMTGPQDCSQKDVVAPVIIPLPFSCATTVNALQVQNGKFVTLDPVEIRPGS